MNERSQTLCFLPCPHLCQLLPRRCCYADTERTSQTMTLGNLSRSKLINNSSGMCSKLVHTTSWSQRPERNVFTNTMPYRIIKSWAKISVRNQEHIYRYKGCADGLFSHWEREREHLDSCKLQLTRLTFLCTLVLEVFLYEALFCIFRAYLAGRLSTKVLKC